MKIAYNLKFHSTGKHILLLIYFLKFSYRQMARSLSYDSPTSSAELRTCLVVTRGDYEVTPGTSQAHSHKSTCCVPRSTYVPTTGALASHYWSQVDTIGQPNHVWEGMRQM